MNIFLYLKKNVSIIFKNNIVYVAFVIPSYVYLYCYHIITIINFFFFDSLKMILQRQNHGGGTLCEEGARNTCLYDVYTSLLYILKRHERVKKKERKLNIFVSRYPRCHSNHCGARVMRFTLEICIILKRCRQEDVVV